MNSLVVYDLTSSEDEAEASPDQTEDIISNLLQELLTDVSSEVENVQKISNNFDKIVPFTLDTKYRDVISDSSDESEEELIVEWRNERQKEESEDEESDEEFRRILEITRRNRLCVNQGPSKPPLKTKGELRPEDLPPLEKLSITAGPEVTVAKLGTVSSVVGCLVVVRSDPSAPAVDVDTVIFSENREAIGQIFDILGAVICPHYSVRFNNAEDIASAGIKVGSSLYFAPNQQEFTKTVFTDALRKLKGSDASWEHNNEPPLDIQEFSDDEEEKRYKAKQRGVDWPLTPTDQSPAPKRPFRSRGRGRAAHWSRGRGLFRGSWPPRGDWRPPKGDWRPPTTAWRPPTAPVNRDPFYMPPPPAGPNPAINVPILRFPSIIDRRFCGE